MIELKITANSADEITTEILELAEKVTGTKVVETPATIGADVLEKVKGVVTSPEKRLEMKGWLTDNGFSRVSEVPADRADELLAFVGIK